MKRLHFLYKVQLELSSPVQKHFFVLRFVPQTCEGQEIDLERVKVSPACQTAQQKDGFGNRLDVGEIRGMHRYFQYEVAGIAKVDGSEKCREKPHPLFRYESPMTRPGEQLKAFYESIRSNQEDPFSRSVQMMHRLFQQFQYCPGSTSVRTTAEEAWEEGFGVCQDYAHLLITLCRMDGISARYAAGMLLGEGASHAWVEIYVDGVWIGLDPTHDRCVDENYIKISHGRDSRDCTVERGVFRGNALQNQNVYVKVEEIW